MNTSKYFYKDKPIFGLDIGFNTIKVMQIEHGQKQNKVIGYGISGYESNAVKDGVIVDIESLAKSVLELFKNNITGEITTRRVALSLPSGKTYTHTTSLPLIDKKDLDEAVALESEQNIPVPINDLYYDYEIVDKNDKGLEILTVAANKKIVDSYLKLMEVLGLEAVSLETSISAAGRLFNRQEEHSDIPAVLIDFGSTSADITIRYKKMIITSTMPAGGDIFTDTLAKYLEVSRAEAELIKTKYGIGKSKKQDQILEILKPDLNQIVREVRRMIRYFEERSGTEIKVGQIISMGGGANMPGLSGYLTDVLRLPVRTCEPWQSFKLSKLKAPSQDEKSVYVTVAGLSLINPEEIF